MTLATSLLISFDIQKTFHICGNFVYMFLLQRGAKLRIEASWVGGVIDTVLIPDLPTQLDRHTGSMGGRNKALETLSPDSTKTVTLAMIVDQSDRVLPWSSNSKSKFTIVRRRTQPVFRCNSVETE